MDKNSNIILESCSTASGGFYGNNVASMIRECFPKSTIYAPEIDTSSNIILDNKGNIIKVLGVDKQDRPEK